MLAKLIRKFRVKRFHRKIGRNSWFLQRQRLLELERNKHRLRVSKYPFLFTKMQDGSCYASGSSHTVVLPTGKHVIYKSVDDLMLQWHINDAPY